MHARIEIAGWRRDDNENCALGSVGRIPRARYAENCALACPGRFAELYSPKRPVTFARGIAAEPLARLKGTGNAVDLASVWIWGVLPPPSTIWASVGSPAWAKAGGTYGDAQVTSPKLSSKTRFSRSSWPASACICL